MFHVSYFFLGFSWLYFTIFSVVFSVTMGGAPCGLGFLPGGGASLTGDRSSDHRWATLGRRGGGRTSRGSQGLGGQGLGGQGLSGLHRCQIRRQALPRVVSSLWVISLPEGSLLPTGPGSLLPTGPSSLFTGSPDCACPRHAPCRAPACCP